MTTADPTTTGSFDWAIYADATLAGLSVLIPVPYADSLTERFFRNRMLSSIAARRNRVLHPQARAVINHVSGNLWLQVAGCLLLPFRFLLDLVLRLSRKILYFLTVKKAVDALNIYWQRAYLLDYMVRQGYLDSAEKLQPAAQALEEVLAEANTSPLTRLARELVHSPRRLVRSVRHARQGVEDEEIERAQREMNRAWDHYAGYFTRLQEQFELAYARQQADSTAEPAPISYS